MINQRRKPIIGVRVEVLHCGNVGVDLAGDISGGMKLGAITGHTGCRILIRTNDMKVVTQGFCWAKIPHLGQFKPIMCWAVL